MKIRKPKQEDYPKGSIPGSYILVRLVNEDEYSQDRIKRANQEQSGAVFEIVKVGLWARLVGLFGAGYQAGKLCQIVAEALVHGNPERYALVHYDSVPVVWERKDLVCEN